MKQEISHFGGPCVRAEAAMRFSRRQRGMEVDDDLAADQALDLHEARAAQQR